jgi:hypothetical protein
VLVVAIIVGLSVKFSIRLNSKVKIDFDIKGVVLMGVITAVTSCLAGAGVCGGCDLTA